MEYKHLRLLYMYFSAALNGEISTIPLTTVSLSLSKLIKHIMLYEDSLLSCWDRK